MRIILLVLTSVIFWTAAKAGDAQWFVSVHGESMQLISGASATADIVDGVYLDEDFVGTEIYVRVQEGYELDGFRPYDAVSADINITSVSETMDSSAAAAEPEEQSMDEFGPLTDTGLQYYLNYDYFGWVCSELYVQPMGGLDYRLRCKDPMEHTG